jgi:hypothetical protein
MHDLEEYREWVVTQLTETVTCECGCTDPLDILIQREEENGSEDHT